MPRRAAVIGSLILFLSVFGLAQGMDAPAGKTAGEVFKNIQVLKDIPAGELLPTMRYITVALGVRCSFCHVEGNFSQDTEHKQTARRMMQMVFAANKSTFNGRPEISCYTCHRGSSHPQGVPPIAGATTAAAHPAASAPAGARPSPDQIVTQYVAALGGADAIAAIQSLVKIGTLVTPRGSMKVEIDRKLPDKELIVLQSEQGVRRQGFDGATAWEQEGDGAPRTESGAGARAAGPPAPLEIALALQHGTQGMRVLGSEEVNGRAAWRVAARRPQGGFELLDFDAANGLLLRVETFQRTPLGALPEATDYSDYRDVQGVKLPFSVRVAGAENARTFQFDSIRANVTLADERFRPAGAGAGSSSQK